LTSTPVLSGAPANRAVAALAFHPVTDVLYGIVLDQDVSPRTADLVTIDTTTGAVTTIGQTLDSMDAIAWAPAGVPTMPVGLLVLLAFIVLTIATLTLSRRPRVA
jgi:hypothetical protein